MGVNNLLADCHWISIEVWVTLTAWIAFLPKSERKRRLSNLVDWFRRKDTQPFESYLRQENDVIDQDYQIMEQVSFDYLDLMMIMLHHVKRKN